MSVLSVYYLTRSINECIISADAHRVPSDELIVCGLTAGPATVINVLSAVTSTAMLMYPPRTHPTPTPSPLLPSSGHKLVGPSVGTGYPKGRSRAVRFVRSIKLTLCCNRIIMGVGWDTGIKWR